MPNENVYTEAHGFKFPNGTTIPIEDSEARQDISEIKSSLSAKGYYTLLNGVSVSNTREAKTLHGSRKLSDYPLYLAFVRVGSGLRASMMLPKTMFQYGSDQISLFYVDASNTQRWFEITWKSDTEVYVQSSSNVANSTTIWLFGILV